MSRNLGSTSCDFCGEKVTLDESPRPITREDAGHCYDTYQGYGHAGMIVANATCSVCEAEYLAWIDQSACAGYGTSGFPNRPEKEEPFMDLSFRSTFDDEPGIADMPKYAIRREIVKTLWPTCVTCGSPTWRDGRGCTNWLGKCPKT